MNNNIKTYRGKDSGHKWKISIVTAKFNSYITDSLQKGAIEVLLDSGLSEGDIEIYSVPGAFEIPLACKKIFASDRADGIVALGAVIKGDTPHFDFVAGECAKGINNIALEYAKPIGFGVITTNTVEQALDRAGIKLGNKGAEAAEGVLTQLRTFFEAGLIV